MRLPRAVDQGGFHRGLNWKVVENKWHGFLEAFHGFDPEYVANLSPKQVEAIAEDPAVIRNRSKIEATVENANVMLEIVKENGTFHDFLASHPNPEETVQDLKGRFHHLGESSAAAFCGEWASQRLNGHTSSGASVSRPWVESDEHGSEADDLHRVRPT